ncbi:MAG: energy transducer TonB [Chitinophagaceae bacterium]|nr:energy transducer TonB [Chitinophagaceae bacterium]MBK9483811.1 energy transducer TonB [Chitinophagaceae bacterium]MBL0200623.1 energy transducer TonB [Chitinophagaceae bacterium]
MEKDLILKTDILDIIFEKRNKLYGAYDLRKFYPNRLKLALGFMFITAISFSAFTFIPKKEKEVVVRVYDIIEPGLKEIKDKPKEPEKKNEVVKAEKKPETKPTPVTQKQFTNNVKVVANNVKTDTIVTIQPNDEISTKTFIATNPGTPAVEPANVEPGGSGREKATPAIDKTAPMDGDAVDVLPSYPGGMDALRKFLQKHLQTPDELEGGQSVSVRVKFVVDYTGKLKSFVTVQDGGDAYNNEVVRVLRKMPDWVPGKTKGENVSVYYVIPVRFETND